MFFSEYPDIFFTLKVDPYICGHRGHASTSCGITFSQFFKFASEPDSDACTLRDCCRKGICD